MMSCLHRSHRTSHASFPYHETRSNKTSSCQVLMDVRRAMAGSRVERHTGWFWILEDVSTSLPWKDTLRGHIWTPVSPVNGWSWFWSRQWEGQQWKWQKVSPSSALEHVRPSLAPGEILVADGTEFQAGLLGRSLSMNSASIVLVRNRSTSQSA